MADQNGLQNLSDIPGMDSLSASGPNPETDGALDNLLKEAGGDIAAPDETLPQTPEEKAEAEAEAKAKAEADAKAKAEADAKAASDATKTDEEKAAADAKAKEEADAKTKADAEAKERNAADGLDTVALPPYVKPATTSAFEQVKTLAREKLQAKDKELVDLTTKLKELTEKGNGKIDPAIEKELAELRKFRKQIDVEADPVFKSYDEKAAANLESIFSKLTEVGTPKESIEKIKEIGVDKVDWDAVKMNPTLRRFIENKLAANIELADQKKAALTSAKANADEYLKTRESEFQKKLGNESEAVDAEIRVMTEQFPWMKEKAGDVEHNKVASDIKEMMKEAIGDNSPKMRALLAMGTAQFVNLRAQSAKDKAAHVAELKARDEKLVAAQKELTDAKALIEKIKKGSTTRLRDTSAIADSPVTKKHELQETAAEALDRHAREGGHAI